MAMCNLAQTGRLARGKIAVRFVAMPDEEQLEGFGTRPLKITEAEVWAAYEEAMRCVERARRRRELERESEPPLEP
jgi:hypothetical protein